MKRIQILMMMVSLLALCLGLRADESTWLNAGSAWENASNWSAGVPRDIARLPTSSAIVNPDLQGGAPVLNQIVFMNKAYSLDGNGAGIVGGLLTLTATSAVPNEVGVGLRVTSQGLNIYANLALGMASGVQTQQWIIARNILKLYGDLVGVGTLRLCNSDTSYLTQGGADFQLFGSSYGFTGDCIVDPTCRLSFKPITNLSSNMTYRFGTSGNGAEGRIELMGDVQNRQSAVLYAVFTTDSTTNVIANIQNPLRITDGMPIQIRSGLGKTSTGTMRLLFSGGVDLGGLLYFDRDGDGMTGWHGNAELGGGIVIDQRSPHRSGVKVTRFSDEHRLTGSIVDGSGPFGNSLILGSDQNDGKLYVDAAGTYAGGTVIDRQGGGMSVRTLLSGVMSSTPGAFGAGPVQLLPGARLLCLVPDVLSGTQPVRMESDAFSVSFLSVNGTGTPPTIDPSSAGVLGLQGTGSAAFNAWVASGAVSNLFLGSSNDGDGTFTGTVLPVGSDGAYRLGGSDRNDRKLVLNAANTDLGALSGNHDVLIGSHRYNAGSYVQLEDTNSFTGTLRIEAPLLNPLNARLNGKVGSVDSPFGSATGNVVLEGGWINLLSGVVAKGSLSFESESSVGVDGWAGSVQTGIRFTLSDINRVSHGGLSLYDGGTRLGSINRVFVTNPEADLTPVNGMIPPCYSVILGNGTRSFATYTEANGFAAATFTATSLSTSVSTDIVNQASAILLASSANCYALRTSGNIGNASASDVTLALGGGGLYLGGNIGSSSGANVNLDFGGAEAVLRNDNIWTSSSLYGTLNNTGGNGLTKDGPGFVYLYNDRNSFLGAVTVNNGRLYVSGDSDDGSGHGSLGPVSNPVILNGGVLNIMRKNATTNTLYRSVTLGPLGGEIVRDSGSISESHIKGSISGPGALVLKGVTLESAEVHHTGGTIIEAYLYGGVIASGAKLGTGKVCVAGYMYGFSGPGNGVYFKGNDSLHYTAGSDVYLPLECTAGAKVYFEATAPVAGSLSGTGDIVLGGLGNTALTVGLDNGDSVFYGFILEKAGKIGSLIKGGTGTFTLNGFHAFTGSTTVSGGELKLHASLAGDVVVDPGCTLSGTGIIGGDTTVNGTLALGFRSTSDYDMLRVAGTLTLNGDLVLNGTPKLENGETVTLVEADNIIGAASYKMGDIMVRNNGTALIATRPAASVVIIR